MQSENNQNNLPGTEPTPIAPNPEPIPVTPPAAEPAPAPAPESTPTPAPEAAPEPASDTTPKLAPELSPEEAAEVITGPIIGSATESAPAPVPTPEPIPESIPVSAPTPADQIASALETANAPESNPDSLVDVATDDSIKIGGNEEKPKKSKKPLLFSIVGVLLAGGIGAGVYFATRPAPAPTPKPQEQKVEQPTVEEPVPESELKLSDNSLSDFDLAFLKLGKSNENKIYSPLSIKYALAMLSDASTGRTKAEIDAVLGDYAPVAYINSENLSLANAFFVRSDFSDKISTVFTSTLKGKYNAEVISDDFRTPDKMNSWIENQTLGILKDTFKSEDLKDSTLFALMNAVAIDMNWNYQIQCTGSIGTGDIPPAPCKGYYNVSYKHEKFRHTVPIAANYNEFEKIEFGDNLVKAGKIGASINNYDIVKELGEDHIRQTVLDAYEQYKLEMATRAMSYDDDYDIDKYMDELKSNYGKVEASTDFSFAVTDNEKVFRKNLKESDGAILEYIGIMPTSTTLEDYVKNLTADSLESVIGKTRPVELNNFPKGVITKIDGYIPFFDFDKEMDLTELLPELGIKDVFNPEAANLSAMVKDDEDASNLIIDSAKHKASITFSTDGIRAAAATMSVGAGGSNAGFQYDWDVPVEEVDLTFDKPFLFLIRNKTTKEVWFMGQVVEIKN